MPRHRSLNLKKFIDSIPEPLVEEYFKQKLGGGEHLSLKAFDYDFINKFLDTIQDKDLKSSILEDFTHINDICEKMMNILVKAVQCYGIETTGEEERQALAMDVFLHHKEAFDYAYDFYCLFNASSKMSHHNITADNFVITPEKMDRFKEKVKAFYFNLAKGQECLVRHYDKEDQAVIVVIHGSYKRSVMVWDGQQIRTLFFRPANEDICLVADLGLVQDVGIDAVVDQRDGDRGCTAVADNQRVTHRHVWVVEAGVRRDVDVAAIGRVVRLAGLGRLSRSATAEDEESSGRRGDRQQQARGHMGERTRHGRQRSHWPQGHERLPSGQVWLGPAGARSTRAPSSRVFGVGWRTTSTTTPSLRTSSSVVPVSP